MNPQLDSTSRQQLANAANNCLISLADDGVLTILIDTRRNLGPSSIRGLSEGGRNDKLYLVSLRLGRAVASDLLHERLVRSELETTGCSSGLGWREVRDTVRSGLQAGGQRPLWR